MDSLHFCLCGYSLHVSSSQHWAGAARVWLTLLASQSVPQTCSSGLMPTPTGTCPSIRTQASLPEACWSWSFLTTSPAHVSVYLLTSGCFSFTQHRWTGALPRVLSVGWLFLSTVFQGHAKEPGVQLVSHMPSQPIRQPRCRLSSCCGGSFGIPLRPRVCADGW